MSVSVAAAQIRILVATIVAVTIYQSGLLSIGDGRAASPASTAEPSASALVPARKQSGQSPSRLRNSAQVVRRRGHSLARGDDPPPRNPPSTELADARQPFLPPVATVEVGEMVRPHGSNAIVAPAPPAVRPQAEAASGTSSQRRDPGDALAVIAALADTYDDTRLSPMWAGSRPSPAPFATVKLVTLFAACSGVAIGVYGVVAFRSRRRKGHA
jgi:hypothetical protein